MYNILKGKNNNYIQFQRSYPSESINHQVLHHTKEASTAHPNFVPFQMLSFFHLMFQAHLIWTWQSLMSNALCHKSSLFPWVLFLPKNYCLLKAILPFKIKFRYIDPRYLGMKYANLPRKLDTVFFSFNIIHYIIVN